MKTQIYLASPYGFADSTKPFLRRLKKKLSARGFKVLDPWQNGAVNLSGTGDAARVRRSSQRSLHRRNMELSEGNRGLIDRAQIVVAALDGPDVDSGTASEIGYAFGKFDDKVKNKPIFGYRGDFRRTGENLGTVVNAQVQYWIERSGGKVVDSVDDLLSALAKARRKLPQPKS